MRQQDEKASGNLIEGVQSRPGIKIGSDHALWTWAARDASCVLNRFQLAMSLSMVRVTRDFWLNMVNQSTVTSRASTKEKRDGVYACSWEKLKGKTPMC